jgi:hypothetical protein
MMSTVTGMNPQMPRETPQTPNIPCLSTCLANLLLAVCLVSIAQAKTIYIDANAAAPTAADVFTRLLCDITQLQSAFRSIGGPFLK